MPGYHIDADGFVYSDQYSAPYIANLRKRIDGEFYSPLHVAGVVLKLMRIMNWRMLNKAVADDPRLFDGAFGHSGIPKGVQVDGQAG